MDERTLEGFLGFNDDDLAANRDGRLSPRQTRRLAGSGAGRLIVGPPFAVGGAAMSLLFDSAIGAVLCLIASGMGLYIAWRGFGFLVDSMDGAVAFVTGPLSGRKVRTRNRTSYWAHIGPVSKRIGRAAFDALPNGVACHLYYAPGCRSLLSVEPATVDEPRPMHPFGPDSAHAWDRLRWSWVLMTIGLLGLVVGGHQVASAHPAQPVSVSGVVSDYRETHGRSTTRTLYLEGRGDTYTPKAEDTYTPPAPSFGVLVGHEVVLYINSGTHDVLAIDDGGQLYAGDWYLHPEHQTMFETVNGAITTVLSGASLLIGVALLVRDRRQRESSAVYGPPTVRPVEQMLPSATVTVVTFIAFLGLLIVAFAGTR